MGTRPLRQYYDHDLKVRFDGLGSIAEPWLRHRRRLQDALGTLTDEQWRAPTNCSDWNVSEVVAHLHTADSFWTLTLQNALDAGPRTAFLQGFDPSTSPDAIIAPLQALAPAEVYDRFVIGTDAFVATVEKFAPADWDAIGESPFGHVPARIILAHAYWDSWLHERDLFLALGPPPPVLTDELQVAIWFSLLFGCAEGGLLGDDAPVGPLPAEPIAVDLRFDELADHPVRVRLDTGIEVAASTSPDPAPAGSALHLVEVVTGRRPGPYDERLPADLVAQLDRAAQIL